MSVSRVILGACCHLKIASIISGARNAFRMIRLTAADESRRVES